MNLARPAPRPAPPASRRRVLRLLAVVAAVTTAGATAWTSAGSAAAAVPSRPGWDLVWSDDFEGAAGSGVNTGNWIYDTGTSYPGGPANWGTGEIQTFTTSTQNVYLTGSGQLAIRPLRDAGGTWTSGRLETQRTDFAAPAGGAMRIEASLRQPDVDGANGSGYWPAFWALGAPYRGNYWNWPGIGEIDIMEVVNGRDSVWATLHCGTAGGGPCNETTGLSSGEQPCSGCKTGYHTFAVEYDRSTSPEEIRWYRDGTRIHRVTADQMDATTWNTALHHGFFLLLNVSIGGAFPAALGGAPNAATVSGRPMYVDYVAVYTRGGGGTPGPTATPTSTTTTTTPPTGSRDAFAQIEAESFDGQSGVRTEGCSDTSGCGSNLAYLANGDWARYDGVDFGSGGATQFRARVASGAGGGVSGLVEVRLDDVNSPAVGSFSLGNTGGWQSWTTVPADISRVTGRHTVYLRLASGQPADFVNVNWFTFSCAGPARGGGGGRPAPPHGPPLTDA